MGILRLTVDILEAHLIKMRKELEMMECLPYYTDLGKRLSDIESKYAITSDELLDISNDVAEFVGDTRLLNIRHLLFCEDGSPRVGVLTRTGDKQYGKY